MGHGHVPRRCGPVNTPDQLSPRLGDGRLVDLPWGLSWAALAQQVPRWKGRPQARASHRIQGLHGEGNSQILTVSFVDALGRPMRETCFVKLTQPGDQEAAKYRELSARRAPVPQLLAAIEVPAGEVIVLEFLPTIGTTPDQADVLLALIAELNLQQVTQKLFSPSPGSPDHHLQIAATLGRMLPDDQAEALLRAYVTTADRVRRLPVELNHNELSFQQVGWTAPGPDRPSHLVAFDLQTVAWLPRFTDLAGMLADLAEQTGRSEQDLFATHLAHRQRLGAAPLDAAAAWPELLQVRFVRTAEALPWYEQMAGQHGLHTPERGLAQLRADWAELSRR